MTELFGIFLLCLTLLTAIGAVRERNLIASVMLMGIFSLLMAAAFFLLDAADVALTEAAVGAGISTVLLLSALALTEDEERSTGARSRIALVIVLLTAATVLYATFDKPPLGDPQAPVQQHLVAEYVAWTRDQIDIPNIVTAVLASFRGYDTLGETIVVFTAGIGVLFLLGAGRMEHAEPIPPDDAPGRGLKHHQPLRIAGKVAIPFIILFAYYVQFHGEYSAGGGFQAGALFAAGVILYGLLEGERRALQVIPPRVLLFLAAGGVLFYGAVGIACLAFGGAFLDYDVLGADPVAAQQLGILLIELGVGVTVAGVLLTIFHAFAAREPS